MNILETQLPTDSTIPSTDATSTLPGAPTSTLNDKQNLSTATDSAGKDNTLLYIAAGFLAYFLFFKKR